MESVLAERKKWWVVNIEYKNFDQNLFASIKHPQC